MCACARIRVCLGIEGKEVLMGMGVMYGGRVGG